MLVTELHGKRLYVYFLFWLFCACVCPSVLLLILNGVNVYILLYDRLVPEKADNKENQLFLKKKRESGRLDIDRRHSYTQATFEDADHWLPALRAEVQHVLSHLVTLSSPVALPIPVLIEELEELLARRRVLSSRGFDRRYTAQLLCEAGVDQHAVLEAYLDVIDHSVDQAVDYQLQLLSSFSAMMKDWIATAERFG